MSGYLMSREQKDILNNMKEEEEDEWQSVKMEREYGMRDEEGVWVKEEKQEDQERAVPHIFKCDNEGESEFIQQDGEELSALVTSCLLKQPRIANSSFPVSSTPCPGACERDQGERSPRKRHKLSPLTGKGSLTQKNCQALTLKEETIGRLERPRNLLPSPSGNGIARLPHEGGRTPMFNQQQEALIIDMVIQNNAISLREMQQRVVEDNTNFEGISSVSLSTIDRVLQRNGVCMKQVYRVPFERNSERVKDQRFQYVQRMFELDSMERPHECIFIDEAGFSLTKRRRRGRNIIGQRSIVQVPGQRGGNVTICAAMSYVGVLHRHATLGPYNTQHLLTFLDGLRQVLFGRVQQNREQEGHPVYVIVWENVSFHRSVLIREWFNNNQQFMNVFLPPYSPFLNPIEEFLSAWRWKVYDRQPYTRENLLQAMELACGDIGVDSCQGWIRHTRGFFPRCLAGENIACDVDEVLWPDPTQRHDAEAE